MKKLNIFNYSASKIIFYAKSAAFLIKNGRTIPEKDASVKEELDALDANGTDKQRYERLIRFKLKEFSRDPVKIGKYEGVNFVREMFNFSRKDLRKALKNPPKNLNTIDDRFDDFGNMIALCTSKLIDSIGITQSNYEYQNMREMRSKNPKVYELLKQSLLLEKEGDHIRPRKEWNSVLMKEYISLLKRSIREYDRMDKVLDDLRIKYNHEKFNHHVNQVGYGRKVAALAIEARKSTVRPSILAIKTIPFVISLAALVTASYFSHGKDIKKVEGARGIIASYESKRQENNTSINSLLDHLRYSDDPKILEISRDQLKYLRMIDKGYENSMKELDMKIASITNDFEYKHWKRAGFFKGRY